MTLTLPRTALAALIGTIGLVAAVPATFAQDAPTPPAPQPQQGKMMPHPGMQRPGMPGHGHHMHRPGMRPGEMSVRGHGRGHMGMHPMMGGGLLNLACSPQGAEAIEIGLVRLSYRVTLTDAQKPLLDDLKTTALAAQKDFADACRAAMPARGNNAATPDPLAGYKARIAVETAHLQALNTVEPKLEAFLGSLDDAQKAKLAPQRPNWGNGMNRHQGQNGWQRKGQQQTPGADQPQPPASGTDSNEMTPAPDDAQG